MIAAHCHWVSEAPRWSRQEHFGRCVVWPKRKSCGCCRARDGEQWGTCQACSMAKEVEDIFKNIRDYLGPGASTISRSRGLHNAKMLPLGPELQQMVWSFMAANCPLQAAGCVCMHLVRKMKEQFFEDNIHFVIFGFRR